MKYPKLFSPLKVGTCVFPNRIMSTAAVTRLAAEDGHVTQNLIDRYTRLARGGLGSMVVEAAVVLPSRSSFNLRISDDQFIGELTGFVDEIRKVNREVKIGLQLIHFLKVARTGWRQKVEDLKPEEIGIIPGQFASAARRARSAGFDFVEIHMAHFTTLASFLSLVNKRADEYGGDFEGRVKLPTEVVRATREAVGADFTVGARILGEEFTKEGNTLLQSARIGKRLAMLGIDYVSVSAGERFEDAETPLPNFPPFAGTGYSGYRMSPRWWNPDGVQVYLAEGVRKAVREAGCDVPVVCAGKVRMPVLAEEILEKGRADIVGMARTLFADPDWPMKAKAARDDEIVKCAACGFCSESDERYETVTCIEWPKGTLNPPSPWLLSPPCKKACPAGLDIRSYIDCAAQGKYEEALEIIENKIPFPGSVGRVCPHPCETACNRASYDKSIAINGLKRFIADKAANRAREVEPFPRTKEAKIAVVGSGPAGLTAAFNLAKLGYGVTVFEAASVPGGMLTLGIPSYRLPKDIVLKEIDRIRKHGVEIRLNTPVSSLDTLWDQGYKAIVIATGAHKSVGLDMDGENLSGIYRGTAFLKSVNIGSPPPVGEKVVVIGGGNVAIDAARSAHRLGAEKVSVLYRRGRTEMPAYPEEIEAAEAEGIAIFYLVAPIKVIGVDGKATRLHCVKTELGEVDSSGRRGPVPVENSEFEIAVDTIITAVGETPDIASLGNTAFVTSEKGALISHAFSKATNVPGIFACGDVATGPATVIEAIAAGTRAAVGVDLFLKGEDLDYEEPGTTAIPIEDVEMSWFKKREREAMPSLALEKRAGTFDEVELGYTELAVMAEADRCFQCGLFPNKKVNEENR